MCGICGFVGEGERATLARMNATLVHRGPDGPGLLHEPGLGLAMRRLAIVDLESGDQPVLNEDGGVVAVFNGEIYNHVELRRQLVARGHRFTSDHSDSEVIVHLYEDYGLDFVDHMNGMFAVALWDRARRRLVLARDRLGIKPLYYAATPHALVFGSEPKALLCHPAVDSAPDAVAIHHYLSLKNIPAPMSAFAAIRQLRAGEIAVFEDGRLETRRYWRQDYREDPTLDEAAAARGVRELLEDSVRLQMRSDVPVGAFLSGGVDSSTVTALMVQAGASQLKSFTLVYDQGFPNKDADRAFAREIAERYGTEHHERLVRPEEVCDRLDQTLGAFDEPYSGVISTFFLTEEIAKHVKVALSGDGADEIFGSYLSHRIAVPLAIARRHPEGPEGLGEEERAWLGEFGAKLDWLFELAALGSEAEARTALLPAGDRAKAAHYSADFAAATRDWPTSGLVAEAMAACGSSDPVNRMLALDLDTLLPDQVLPFVDRLSMAHSVEVRPPFLDHRLVEFTARIPGQMKVRPDRVKHILKEAVRDLLPPALLDRPKEGFLMPIRAWLLTHMRDFVEDSLAPARLARHGYLDPARVRATLDEQYAGVRDHGDWLWNLLMFQKWWDSYQGAEDCLAAGAGSS